jgi:hypothetical protein
VTAAVFLPGAASMTVPYITRWSAERDLNMPVVQGRRRIAYADERPSDRDDHDVLWTRVSSLPGQGRPEWGSVHARRQRKAMTRLLCQVCGQRPDRNGDGILWLVGEDPARPDTWPDELLTAHPPVCIGCAAKSVRLCTHLRRQYAALRVSAFELVGVRGALYIPGISRPVTVTGVAFDDPRVRWIRAGQLLAHLRDFTITRLPAPPPGLTSAVLLQGLDSQNE